MPPHSMVQIWKSRGYQALWGYGNYDIFSATVVTFLMIPSYEYIYKYCHVTLLLVHLLFVW